MPTKVFSTPAAAFADLRDRGLVFDGMTVMVGGFGLCGIPEQLIIALRDSGVRGITAISNNAGVDDWGLGLLLRTRQIKKMISSYVGENATFEKQFLSGELEIEFNPQGTLAERIRAGGAGIPAFYTATGVGTPVAEGKEERRFFRPSDDTRRHNRPGAPGACSTEELGAASSACVRSEREPRPYILETGLYADLALVKAAKADEFGNLVYNKTARNFNPMMATAAAFVIAEVEEVVATGSIDADGVHTPGNYVDRIVRTRSEKRIEQRTVRPVGSGDWSAGTGTHAMPQGSKSLRQILIRYLSEPRPAALVVDGLLALLAWVALARVSGWFFSPGHEGASRETTPQEIVADVAWATSTMAYYFGLVLCAWGCARLIAESWGRPPSPPA